MFTWVRGRLPQQVVTGHGGWVHGLWGAPRKGLEGWRVEGIKGQRGGEGGGCLHGTQSFATLTSEGFSGCCAALAGAGLVPAAQRPLEARYSARVPVGICTVVQSPPPLLTPPRTFDKPLR